MNRGNDSRWGGWVRTGVGYIGILSYLIVFDYARIYTVMTDESSMRKAMWRGAMPNES